MSNKDVVTILNEEFENEKTGEKLQGLTIIVDGKLKQVIDIIIEKNDNYSNYTEVVKDALFEGLNNIINKINK
ncbi:hypothetical protein ACTJJY_21140 [Bacillus sp. 22475]|uniref:hypothetical protein n=1 Tax=Bacillus TaxID=1386 RepID=UPI003642E83A